MGVEEVGERTRTRDFLNTLPVFAELLLQQISYLACSVLIIIFQTLFRRRSPLLALGRVSGREMQTASMFGKARGEKELLGTF